MTSDTGSILRYTFQQFPINKAETKSEVCIGVTGYCKNRVGSFTIVENFFFLAKHHIIAMSSII